VECRSADVSTVIKIGSVVQDYEEYEMVERTGISREACPAAVPAGGVGGRCGAMGQTHRHSHFPLASPPRFPA
jgi:hypothetical protein